MDNESHEKFVQSLRVQFNETDAMGVVHHGNYVKSVEQARVEMPRERGVSYLELTASGRHLPVVEMQFRYHSPARFDGWLSVELWGSQLRRASVVFRLVVTCGRRALCSGTTKLACVNAGTVLRALPGKVIAALGST